MKYVDKSWHRTCAAFAVVFTILTGVFVGLGVFCAFQSPLWLGLTCAAICVVGAAVSLHELGDVLESRTQFDIEFIADSDV